MMSREARQRCYTPDRGDSAERRQKGRAHAPRARCRQHQRHHRHLRRLRAARDAGAWRPTSSGSADEYAVTMLGLLRAERADRVRRRSRTRSWPASCPTLRRCSSSSAGATSTIDPLVVGTGTKTGVRILYDNPREVGADRIVDVVAACTCTARRRSSSSTSARRRCSTPCRPTATTWAAPSPPASASRPRRCSSARRSSTACELERPKTAIGKNTVGAIQSGTLYGYVGLIEGMVARFKEELGGYGTRDRARAAGRSCCRRRRRSSTPSTRT